MKNKNTERMKEMGVKIKKQKDQNFNEWYRNLDKILSNKTVKNDQIDPRTTEISLTKLDFCE